MTSCSFHFDIMHQWAFDHKQTTNQVVEKSENDIVGLALENSTSSIVPMSSAASNLHFPTMWSVGGQLPKNLSFFPITHYVSKTIFLVFDCIQWSGIAAKILSELLKDTKLNHQCFVLLMRHCEFDVNHAPALPNSLQSTNKTSSKQTQILFRYQLD